MVAVVVTAFMSVAIVIIVAISNGLVWFIMQIYPEPFLGGTVGVAVASVIGLLYFKHQAKP